jgi:hypothetical protein
MILTALVNRSVFHLEMFYVRDAARIGVCSIYVSIDYETAANVLYSMALSRIELFISSL